jgi:apolipoprotein D and lipocalin family protein
MLQWFRALGVSAVMMLHVLAWADAPAPLQAIASLDVQRYLGRWYEIAKFPNVFQKQCVADTSAQYALQGDGSLRVLNQCRNSAGEIVQAVGQAKQTGPADSPKLRVRFAPEWLSFLPFVWGDYWVIDLDASYALAAVSEPGRDYLWILSRTPSVDPVAYGALLQRLAQMGLDIGRLEKSPQPLALRSPS